MKDSECQAGETGDTRHSQDTWKRQIEEADRRGRDRCNKEPRSQQMQTKKNVMQALSPVIMDNGRGSQRFGTVQDNLAQECNEYTVWKNAEINMRKI